MSPPRANQAAPGKHVFEALDGLRGIAALAVVIMHARPLFGPSHDYMLAYLAVDLFFGLSGFVLDHAYGARLRAGMSIGQFMVRRLVRLYPLYFAAFLIAVTNGLWSYIAHGGAGGTLAIAALSQVLMIPIPLAADQYLFPLNSPSWSLFWELCINAVFVATYRWLTIRVIAAICVIFAPLMFAAIWFYHGLNGGVMFGDLPVGFVRVTFSFFAGVLINRLRERFAAPGRAPHAANASATIFGLAMFAGFLTHPHGALHAIIDAALVTVGFPVLIFFGARIVLSGGIRRLCLVFGAASYAIYVLHMPCRDLTMSAMTALSIAPSPWLGATFVVAVAILSLALDRWYDLPARRWLTKVLPGA